MLRRIPVALALGLIWGVRPIAGFAQAEAPAAEVATPLGEVSVSSTRTERRTDDIPATVTVTPAGAIERQGAHSIKDVFRNELDVSLPMSPTRFTAAGASTGRAGTQDINIRGLEGNRVLMLVDGIRVPDGFSFASFSTGRGEYLDVDGIGTAEVLRGPASTQYGSDGLAGALVIRTPEPADLLRAGADAGGFVRLGYAQVDRSWSATAGAAGVSGRWQGLLLTSLRNGHEIGNKGSNDAQDSTRTTPNPVDYDNRYLLGKALFSLDDHHQFGLTLESQNRHQRTEVYSARAVPPLASTSVLDLDTNDRISRERVSFEHRFLNSAAALFQRAETRVYRQEASVRQFSAEDRNTAADRTRDNLYEQKVTGLSTQFESRVQGPVRQRIIYGLDWSRAEITGVRDGTVAPFGETFPTRPFPDTDYTLLGAFVQSELELGALTVIPALRFDHYELSPSTAGYTGGAVTKLSDQAVTPRLGVVWRLQPAFSPYFQWARGFKAPTPDQVNNGFSNLASGYMSVGNPELKPERAESIELGFRGSAGDWRYSMAAFDNRYEDFIDQELVGGSATPADPSIYQYINLSNARIHGLEGRTEWRISRAWSAKAGFAWAHGRSELDGVRTPLDSVNPLKLVLGLRYDTGVWGARADVVHSRAKERDRVDTLPLGPGGSEVEQFTTPSWTTLDLGVFWKPVRNLTLVANLNNVFDTRYWRWSDSRGLAATTTISEAFTAPGRNLQLSLRYDL